jgi:RNA polymerase sigma-70 factor (ECF subfamily)
MRAVAFRMLGSQADADDAVQEVWFRLRSTDHERVDNIGGWLTTVVARICLDRLRARRAKREVAFVGDEPTDDLAAWPSQAAPEDQALMAESVGAALLVVLDALGPSERVAFVLHDIFGVPFDEVGSILDRSPEAARQLASRARRRVQGTARTADVDLPRQRTVVEAFLRAARAGDFTALLEVLDPDVEVRVDAAVQRAGGLRSIRGAAEVARTVSSGGGARAARLALIDGLAGLVWAPAGHIRGVSQFTVVDGRITEMEVIGDADHIRSLDLVVLADDA